MISHYTGMTGKSGYRNFSLKLNHLEIKQVSSICVVDKKAWSFIVHTDSTSLCYNIFNWMIKYLIFLPPDCYWLVPQHTYTCCSMAEWSSGQWPLVVQRSCWWTGGRNSSSPDNKIWINMLIDTFKCNCHNPAKSIHKF